MSADKVLKIKKYNFVRNNKNQLFLKKRNDCGTRNLIEYILDKHNLNVDDYNNLSKDDKDKILSEIISKKNQSVENFDKYNEIIKYISNENKCFDELSNSMLVDSLNCDNTFNAVNEFIDCEKEYHKHKIESCNSKSIPNEAFHIIQSFKGKDLPAEKVHKIGIELAKRLCGTSFKTVITTHTNTDNFHNHIAICAYACDGLYKFRDAWNLGLKLQKLSNEISLENGISIITELANDKYENEDESILDNQLNLDKSPHFTRIGEKKLFDSDKLTKATLINDIILTAKNSKSWNEYEIQMNLKGYDLVKQAKSIKYVKRTPNGTTFSRYNEMRDTRLGKQYTKEAITRFINEQNRDNLINNDVYYHKIKINIKSILPKKFVGTGKNITRVPLILRMFSFLLKLLELLIFNNSEYVKTTPKLSEEQKSIIKDINKQARTIKTLIKHAEELIEKYNIQNYNSLCIKKKQLLSIYCKHKNLYLNRVASFNKFKQIKNAINTMHKYQMFIDKHGLSDDNLCIYKCGEANILENLAKIDPMQPHTKSRLYQALHNSNFKLKYHFNQLTEKDAKEICYFMAEINKGNNATIPNTLYTKKEYNLLKHTNQLHEPEYTPRINNLKKPNLSNFSKQDKDIIIKYKKSKQLLNSFGLTNDDKINSFVDYMNIIDDNYKTLEYTLSEEKNDLKELSLIEDLYNGKIEEKYKPIKLFEDKELIENEINKYKDENESAREQLITLKTLFNDPDILSSLNMLDNEQIIIAPSEILSLVKCILACEGKDVELNELLKYSKEELKQIISDFKAEYDIDAYLKTELKNEINTFKKEIEKEIIEIDKQEERKDQQIIIENEIINKLIDGFIR